MKLCTQSLALAVAIGALGLAAPSLALAAGCDGNQMQMNVCAAKQLKTADAQLNAVYKAYSLKLDAAHQAALKNVQLNWIRFRDSACDFASADYKGGSIYPLEVDSCLADITKQRREQLEALLKDSDK